MKTRELDKVDAYFVMGAPARGTLRQRIPAAASALFRAFEDADAWPEWLNGVDDVTWTSDLGPGATRTIRVRNMTTEEFFFDWVPGELMSFRFDRSQLPLFRAFAERYQIEAISDDECELMWSYGFTARGPLKLVHPIMSRIFGRNAKRSLAQLADFMAANKAEYS